MNILLLCDKTVPALFPLQGELPVSQLPVADKTIAEYHLELVCKQLRPQKVTLITGNYQNMLQQQMGSGVRWGVEISYCKTLVGEQSLPQLIIPCDRLSSLDLAFFLQRIADNPAQSAVGMAGQTPAVYWIAQTKDWREFISGVEPLIGDTIVLPEAVSQPIEAIRDFYQINLGLVQNRFPSIDINSYHADDGLLLASRAHISQSVIRDGRAFVGTASHIGNNVYLRGDCIVGHHVKVDNNAQLADCVILPHTYIGNWVSINNAVVSGSFIWQIDTDVCLQVKERFLISPLPANTFDNWIGGFKRQPPKPGFLPK